MASFFSKHFMPEEPHKKVVPFDVEMRERKGHGFFHDGKEFIHHSTLPHHEIAYRNLTRSQKIFLSGILAMLIVMLLINWHTTLVVLFSLLTILYFIDLLFSSFLIAVSLGHRGAIKTSEEEIKALSNDDLPVYTVFCPLYREWQVVPQFVKSISALDYPQEKLQVILLLEENDGETIDKVKEANLPSNFETVIVPHSVPKTKPKAMNYGMKHVRGDYLVIYDAEDMPDPLQLKKAITAFSKADKSIVCMQAKLNFYNPRQNTLTRVFTAEYSLWFDLILPGLHYINAPIPLGGTSNHFKMEYLRTLQGWDAFNVTEDCDLGMRLAKKGFRTAIIDSTTYEEANSDLRNWFNQRSRWIKGYIQTYFVHMRNPRKFLQESGWFNFLAFQLTIGGKTLSMFVNPMMWFITFCYFAFRSDLGLLIQSFFPPAILYIGVFAFVFGNFIYLYNYMIGCVERGYNDIVKYVFIVPIYWLFMSFIAWRSVYEFLVKPHYWSKTLHGLHLQKKPA